MHDESVILLPIDQQLVRNLQYAWKNTRFRFSIFVYKKRIKTYLNLYNLKIESFAFYLIKYAVNPNQECTNQKKYIRLTLRKHDMSQAQVKHTGKTVSSPDQIHINLYNTNRDFQLFTSHVISFFYKNCLSNEKFFLNIFFMSLQLANSKLLINL